MEDKIKLLEDKIASLENQAYITYLQLNSAIKQLSEKGTIDTEQLIKDMDELNKKLIEALEEEGKNKTSDGESA